MATKTNSRHWWEEEKANEEIIVIEDFQEGSMADKKVFSTMSWDCGKNSVLVC